jgi:hypothetical protein
LQLTPEIGGGDSYAVAAAKGGAAMRVLPLLLVLAFGFLHADLAAALPAAPRATAGSPTVERPPAAVPLTTEARPSALACTVWIGETPVDTIAAATLPEPAARRPRQCIPYGRLCSPSADQCCEPLRCAFDGYAAWCRY